MNHSKEISSNYFHTHPITIIKNLSGIMFLLIIPVGRGLFIALTEGSIARWLQGAYVDIIVVSIGVGIATAIWHEQVYRTDKKGIYIKKGILRRRKFFIGSKNIATLIVVVPFYYRLFGAVRLIGDTNAGMARSTDFDIIVYKKDLERILKNRQKNIYDEHFVPRSYKPHTLYIAIFSAFLSNSLAGVLLFSSFFSQMGVLVGEEIEERLINTVSTILESFASTIPVVFSGIAIAIISGWMLAFIRNLTQYILFNACRTKNEISVNVGIFTKRSYRMLIDKVNYLDIRQSIMTKIFKLQITYIYCTGYGKDKNIAPVLVPAAKKSDMKSTLNMLIPELKVRPRKLKPKKLTNMLGYIAPPILLSVGAYLLAFSLTLFLPDFIDIIRLIAVVMAIPFVWIFLIKLFDFMTTGIGKNSKSITLYYSSPFYLHTIIVPMNKITKVVIRQSPLQKISGTCTVMVYSFAEKRKKHTVKSIDLNEALSFFRMNPNN